MSSTKYVTKKKKRNKISFKKLLNKKTPPKITPVQCKNMNRSDHNLCTFAVTEKKSEKERKKETKKRHK